MPSFLLLLPITLFHFCVSLVPLLSFLLFSFFLLVDIVEKEKEKEEKKKRGKRKKKKEKIAEEKQKREEIQEDTHSPQHIESLSLNRTQKIKKKHQDKRLFLFSPDY